MIERLLSRYRWWRYNRTVKNCMCGEPGEMTWFLGPMKVAWCQEHIGIIMWCSTDDPGIWKPMEEAS